MQKSADHDSTSILWEISKSKQEIQNYLIIRKEVYQTDLKLDINNEMDDFDKYSHFLIGKSNDVVVGGGRLTYSFDGNLPHAEYTGTLQELKPKKFTNTHYAEVSRVALIEEHRSLKTMRNFYQAMDEHRKQEGVADLLTFAPVAQARLSYSICRAMGYDVDLKRNIPLPTDSVYRVLGEMCILHIHDAKYESVKRDQTFINSNFGLGSFT